MDFRAILAGVTFALIWSSAFTSARIIVTNAPPLTVSAIRFLIAGLIALALARALGQSFRLTPQQWRLTIIFGICPNALYLGLNFIAMQTIEASLAAIIASSLPLLVALVGWLILGETVRPLGVVGLIAGIAGVLLIMGTRLGAGVDPVGVALRRPWQGGSLAACGGTASHDGAPPRSDRRARWPASRRRSRPARIRRRRRRIGVGTGRRPPYA